MPSRHYGDPYIAARLKAARKGAGFATARAAAARFGWSAVTLSSHERGQRALSEADALRYAGAFGVGAEWLLSAHPADDDDEFDDGADESRQPSARWRRMGLRLAVARRLADFATAVDAVRHFDFSRSTYAGHESGSKGELPRAAAEVYGAAFGVSAEWLRLAADAPRQIPPVVEAALRDAEFAVAQAAADGFPASLGATDALWAALKAHASPARRGSRESVDALRELWRLRRSPDDAWPADVLTVPEVVWHRPSRTLRPAQGGQTWAVPTAALPFRVEGSLVFVVIGEPVQGAAFQQGDRVLVATGMPPHGGRVALVGDDDGALRLGAPTDGGSALGAVLAVFGMGVAPKEATATAHRDKPPP